MLVWYLIVSDLGLEFDNISVYTNLILLDLNGTQIFQKNKEVILDELAASCHNLSLWAAEPHQMDNLVLIASGNNTTAQTLE